MMNNIKLLQKTYSLLFLLLPIINQYRLGPLTFWEWFTIFGCLLWMLLPNKWLMSKNMYLIFALYTIVFVPINAIFYCDMETIQLLLRYCKYIFVIYNIMVVAPKLIEMNIITKYYRYIVMLVSIVLCGQYLFYILFDKSTYLILSNISLNYNNGVNSSLLLETLQNNLRSGYYYRPSSFFLEPAIYALYVFPYIIIQLYNGLQSEKYIWNTIFVSVCAVLTTSSIALIGGIVIWGIYFLSGDFKKKFKKNYLIGILLIVVIISGGCFLALQQGVLTTVQIKMQSLENLSEASSTTIRLIRGFLYFSQMELFPQIFGVGYGNLVSYYHLSNMHILYDAGIDELSYMNAFCTVLCSFGIIGMFLFILFLIFNYRTGNKLSRMMITYLFLVMLGSDMFDSPIYYIMIVMIIVNKTNYYRNNFIVK